MLEKEPEVEFRSRLAALNDRATHQFSFYSMKLGWTGKHQAVHENWNAARKEQGIVVTSFLHFTIILCLISS
jgi:hypothetical protein